MSPSAHTPAPAALAASPAGALARVPVSFFSMVLGLAALAAAWRAAARAYATSAWLADALLVAAAVLWVVLLGAQVLKAATAPGRLRAELADPVEGSLAALAPASLLAVAAGISGHYPELAGVLFWIGAGATAAAAAWTLGGWLVAPPPVEKVTPAMYLPSIVGPLLAAAAAGAVGKSDAGWVFFGAGLLSWLGLGAVMLSRHLSAGELSPSLRPHLGLELAPPALALLAYQALQGAGPDATARGLLGYALLVALVLLRLAASLRDVPFAPAHWSFAFPLAALAAAALRQGSAAPGGIAGALALPIFVVANAVVAVVAFHTVVAASRGTLLPPE